MPLKSASTQQDAAASALALFTARRSQMKLNMGKRVSQAKDAVKALRERYDALLQPWLGGASSSDVPPDPEVDRLLAELSPLLEGLYTQALAYYRASLDEQSGLDFDDLEAGTVALLRNPAIRAHWQAEVAAVLVDEFQDTNDRQREIILGLCGEQPGRLFVVGDARQSIYRFRGADVTVFTGLQSEIQRQGGRSIDLDRTFRAHPALLIQHRCFIVAGDGQHTRRRSAPTTSPSARCVRNETNLDPGCKGHLWNASWLPARTARPPAPLRPMPWQDGWRSSRSRKKS